MDTLPHSPACERNKQPILEVLLQVLPAQGRALEIAAGTGQHAEHFAAALPGWQWQPTDADASMLPAIDARMARSGLARVQPALLLDVLATPWPVEAGAFDAVYCANMLHIAPWACCAALMQGAARALTPQGVLVTYGPYLEDGVLTAVSNLAFDASLRSRDPDWGLRRLEDVAQQARQAGLRLAQRHALPANNLLLVWSR